MTVFERRLRLYEAAIQDLSVASAMVLPSRASATNIFKRRTEAAVTLHCSEPGAVCFSEAEYT